MKKLIVDEVNLFRAEVRAVARSNQSRNLSIPTRDEIVSSPIHGDAPPDGATSSYYSGQTPLPGGARRPPSPVIDDPSAELERELAGTHLGRH